MSDNKYHKSVDDIKFCFYDAGYSNQKYQIIKYIKLLGDNNINPDLILTAIDSAKNGAKANNNTDLCVYIEGEILLYKMICLTNICK